MSAERTQEIEEAASGWLIRRDSGAWTEGDQSRFDAWLATSTLHRVAYLRLEAAWEDAERLKALGAGIAGESPPPRGEWNLSPFFDSRDHKALPIGPVEEEGTLGGDPESVRAPPSVSLNGAAVAAESRRKYRIGYFAIAASLVLAVGGGSYRRLLPAGERYSTPIGGVTAVGIPDGSKVTLNTDTEIRVSLTQTERLVDLKRGEAFFDVAKDPRRPFVVNAGGKRVIAVGTQFSVRRDARDVEIVVTEGQVRVEDGGETVLSAGSVARAGDAGVLVQRKSVPQAHEILSWRIGILMFRDESLGEAVAEFNRYNTRKIVIADSKVANLRIEGNFRATNVDAFVRLLESGFPVHARTEENQVLLTAN